MFILVLYRLNPQLEFLMMKQKQSGLLSGLWSFFEINSSNELDQINERKRKDFIIEEIQRTTTINIENIKLAGQVTVEDHRSRNHLHSSVVIYFLISINNTSSITRITMEMRFSYLQFKVNGLLKNNYSHQQYLQL